jgi:hypothetical protein
MRTAEMQGMVAEGVRSANQRLEIEEQKWQKLNWKL